MKQKHYLIYQVTNLLNNKIYVGKHETFNIEDRYFGSGKIITAAIKKHGIENFEFKILIDLKNEEEMNLLEKMVVTEEFCRRDDVYNIKVGGDGGWDHVNKIYTTKQRSKNSKQAFQNPEARNRVSIGTKKAQSLFSIEKKQKISEKCRQSRLKFIIDHPNFFKEQIDKNPNYGKHTVSSKTKETLSNINKGNNNPAFGKHWYKDPHSINCSLFYDGEQPDGWIKGKYASKNETKGGKHNIGMIWITNIKTKNNKVLPKDKAALLVKTGEWEYGRFQKSKIARN